MPSNLPLIACTLDAAGQRDRLAEWADLLRSATTHEETPTGVRYRFRAADGLERQIRSLAAAEKECCAFLEFDVTTAGERLELSVNAPPEGQDALRFVFPVR